MCDSCFPFWILTIVGKRKEENIPKQAKTSFKNWRCRLQGWGGPRKMRCELTVSLPGLHFIVLCYRQHIPFTGTLLQGECSSEYFVAQLWISESHHEETVVLCWSPCSAIHFKTLQHLTWRWCLRHAPWVSSSRLFICWIEEKAQSIRIKMMPMTILLIIPLHCHQQHVFSHDRSLHIISSNFLSRYHKPEECGWVRLLSYDC